MFLSLYCFLGFSAAEPMLVMSLALLGKLCILAAIFISILYSIELFPTGVRYDTRLKAFAGLWVQ